MVIWFQTIAFSMHQCFVKVLDYTTMWRPALCFHTSCSWCPTVASLWRRPWLGRPTCGWTKSTCASAWWAGTSCLPALLRSTHRRRLTLKTFNLRGHHKITGMLRFNIRNTNPLLLGGGKRQFGYMTGFFFNLCFRTSSFGRCFDDDLCHGLEEVISGMNTSLQGRTVYSSVAPGEEAKGRINQVLHTLIHTRTYTFTTSLHTVIHTEEKLKFYREWTHL